MYFKFISIVVIVSSISGYLIYQSSTKKSPQMHLEAVNKQKTEQPVNTINSLPENLPAPVISDAEHEHTEESAIHLPSPHESESNAPEIEQPGIEPEFSRLIESQMQEAFAIVENYHPLEEENLTNQELLDEMEQALAALNIDSGVTSYNSDGSDHPEGVQQASPATRQVEEDSNEENNNFSDFDTNESILAEMEEHQLIAEQHLELVPEYQADQYLLDEMERETTHTGLSEPDPRDNIDHLIGK